MRHRDDSRQAQQAARHPRFVFEHIEPSARDLFRLERAHQCRLIDDRAARRIDDERGRLHQLQLPVANHMTRIVIERRM